MKSEICANCGYEKEEHIRLYSDSNILRCLTNIYKEFFPKNKITKQTEAEARLEK